MIDELTIALAIQRRLSCNQSCYSLALESLNYPSISYATVPGSSPEVIREASQAQRAYVQFKKLALQDPAAGMRIIKGIKHLEFPLEEYLDAACVENVYYHLGGFCCLLLSFLRW